MTDPGGGHARAKRPSEGDVIAVLLQQHARIRELSAEVRTALGDRRQRCFDELRALLAVHETAEEMVLRPLSRRTAGAAVAEARDREEAEANQVLAELERLDVSSAAFEERFARFARSVTAHAEHEEEHEFPALRAGCDRERLVRAGQRLRAAERIAPTHPHPRTAGSTAAQWTVGPFASLVDRARDALQTRTFGA